MFVRNEETPNPLTLKFIPDGETVCQSGTHEFKKPSDAESISPLALQLFNIEGVKSIFFGKDFITITKTEAGNWSLIKSESNATIMDFFVSGRPIFFDTKSKKDQSSGENDSEVVKQIKELIEIKVRPAVAMDGGDIIFDSFEEGIVRLKLKGACSGCPSSTITLKNGIENMLKHYVPEVELVEQVMDDEY